MSKQITITVSGSAGAGKTTVAAAVYALLQHIGFTNLTFADDGYKSGDELADMPLDEMKAALIRDNVQINVTTKRVWRMRG